MGLEPGYNRPPVQAQKDMKKILILSDIHGNLEALKAVLKNEDVMGLFGIILLGDMIDYGPRSNEVVQMLKMLPKEKILVNLWGNHEKAILTENFEGFSSQRGIESAMYTQSILDETSRNYLNKLESSGKQEFQIGKKKCLAIHGSLFDVFWKSIRPENVYGDYRNYDYVFSGHSHCSHCFDMFYDNENAAYRNKKRVMFINPGSVGQPRNHNPDASYAQMDVETEEISLKRVAYDVEEEQRYFSDRIDHFYKLRLEKGI